MSHVSLEECRERRERYTKGPRAWQEISTEDVTDWPIFWNFAFQQYFEQQQQQQQHPHVVLLETI